VGRGWPSEIEAEMVGAVRSIRTRYGNALLNAASALSATGVVHDDDLDPRSVLQRHRTGPRHLAGRERLT